MSGYGRRRQPSPAALGLTRQTAAEDLEFLGWNNPKSLDLLWCLASAGDPDLALNNLVRLVDALGEDSEELTERMRRDEGLRVRLIALLGASTALGDHLVAHPAQWHLLEQPLPEPGQMVKTLLQAVAAQPAQFAAPLDASDTATEELDALGTYRACVIGFDGKKALREAYRNLVMQLAAYDLAGTFRSRKGQSAPQPEMTFAEVTRRTSALADAALTAALAVAVGTVYGTGRDGDAEPLDVVLAIIALGKCGAQELNYISDVDVVFVAETCGEQDSLGKARRLASEVVQVGTACFFDVDANLRPEGKSGALVRTLDSYVSYYKRWAETWEFQALLKARPQTGSLPLGRRFAHQIGDMVWRASERESFVEDVQRMRRRVLDNVPKDLKNRELKLGAGSLRDVEFAVQLLQLVHGRSDETLRQRSTVGALYSLVDGGYMGREDGNQLIEDYKFLRLIEHRLQLERFRRTHTMPEPADRNAWDWLAAISGFEPDGMRSAAHVLSGTLKRARLRISDLHSKLFYRPLLSSAASMSSAELKLSPEAAKLQLAALGYGDPARAFEHLSSLVSGSSRKARIQAILLPTLMEWLSYTADPDAGLLNYRKLSEAAFDRTWFLRTLRDEGIVGQRLMHILGTSPYASSLIIAAPDVVKLFSDGSDGPKLLDTSTEQVSSALINSTRRHLDPTKAVNVARSLRRVELARIAAADLLGFVSVPQVCEHLSTIWNAVLESALRAEVRAWRHTHDDARPPARIAVIGMGRLGGMELGFGSDADVLFVAEPSAEGEGTDPLAWATMIVDSLRRRLAKPSGDPPLEVDLGLRPEGRSGAVVRTLESYERYYSRWGEPWEMQALLRASFVAGDAEVGQRFMELSDQFRYPAGGTDSQTIRQIRRMKARVDNERLPRGADRNTHTKLGRGALTDIEWTVQLLTMLHADSHPALRNPSTLRCLDALEEEGLLSREACAELRDAWLMATDARNALVLVRGKRVDQLPQPGRQLAQVAAALGWDPTDNQEFLEAYLKTTRHARRVVDEVFWGEAKSFEHE